MPTVDVWCPTCGFLDVRWLRRGDSVNSLCCIQCGDAVKTPRHCDARKALNGHVFARNAAIVRNVAAGNGDIEDAVAFARYAAHTAFKLKLVPNGPEPAR